MTRYRFGELPQPRPLITLAHSVPTNVVARQITAQFIPDGASLTSPELILSLEFRLWQKPIRFPDARHVHVLSPA